MDTKGASPHFAFPQIDASKGAAFIIRALFSEFLLDVSKEYDELDKGSLGPIKLTPGEFQIELLIFSLHCLDRAVFQIYGKTYRKEFMDAAVSASRGVVRQCFSGELGPRYLAYFDGRYNVLQTTYGRFHPEADSSALRDSLFYQFGKRLCSEADVYNPATLLFMTLFGGEVFIMMYKQAQTLQ